MKQTLFSSLIDDGSARAIAGWENEGGATAPLPSELSTQMQQDLLELEISRAILTTGFDDEGAFRPFHSFPWAIPSTVVE